MVEITSRENPTYKMVKSLARKKGRTQTGMYFAEGVRLVEEALQDAAEQLVCILVSASYTGHGRPVDTLLGKTQKPVYVLRDALFRTLCGTETPQGIAAVLRIPQPPAEIPAHADYLLIIDGVAEPGNLGTILRTAEAAGVDLVCLRAGSADLYNPKVVRSTMGSVFRVPVMPFAAPELLDTLHQAGFLVIATALQPHAIPPQAVTAGKKRALIIGSEASGVSEDLLARADACVRLPMAGRVESLNAAVAAGILLYQFKTED